MNISVFCNGTSISIYVPAQNICNVTTAPENLENVENNGIGMISSPTALLAVLLKDKPYERVKDAVTSGSYIGLEKSAGVECHRLRFSQELMDWDIWIPVAGQRLPVKIVPDFSKLQAMTRQQFGDLEASAEVKFENWKIDQEIPESVFEFIPPEGTKIVDDQMGNEHETEIPELLGKAAPEFELELLDGGHVTLSQLKNKKIVVLDFWATWCGPCVMAMPEIIAATRKFEDKDVVLYAVNQGESKAIIKRFLDKEKLKVTVALDPDHKTGNSYNVEGIPSTIVIAKDGTIQAIHSGFSDDLGSTLESQLTAIIAGKNIAVETLASTSTSTIPQPLADVSGVATSWTLAGKWDTVAAHSDGRIFVANAGGQAAELNSSGTKVRSLKFPGSPSTLRCCNLNQDTEPEFLSFGSWDREVIAFDIGGNILWKYPTSTGVDDAWPADLDNDGRDEILIGLNGDGGLHAVNSKGEKLWAYTDIGNVWHVCAADFEGKNNLTPISTSALGQVHIFDREGKKLRDLSVKHTYANALASIRVPGETADWIVTAGTGQIKNGRICALNADGVEKWATDLGAEATRMDPLSCSTPGYYVAVAIGNGTVAVLNAKTGKILAQIPGFKKYSKLAWANRKESAPMLLIADGNALIALEIKGND